jgi:hypothetical protein
VGRRAAGSTHEEDIMTKLIMGLSLGLALAGARAAEPAAEPARERSDAAKIENALSAAPGFISDHATVMDWPSEREGRREMRTLRKGTKGWTCMPDLPGRPRHDPMCVDETMMKWMMATMAGRPPNIDKVGIAYMLQGEAGADPNDLSAGTPPPGKDWYHVGPHVMIVLPDACKDALRDQNRDPSTGEPYVAVPASSSPLLVVPVAGPDEAVVTEKRKAE